MPDDYNRTYAYGRVVSFGNLVINHIDVEEGEIVCFDSMGARDIELHPRDDADLVVIHATQVYCSLVEAQLEKRKLPIPR